MKIFEIFIKFYYWHRVKNLLSKAVFSKRYCPAYSSLDKWASYILSGSTWQNFCEEKIFLKQVIIRFEQKLKNS